MRRCTNCQAEVPAGASFCTQCGTLLEGPQARPRPNEFAATIVDQPIFATETVSAQNNVHDDDIEGFAGVVPAPNLNTEATQNYAGSPTLDPMLGRVIAGKFKIESLLGVGGMGKVYEAQHLVLEKTIALKVLHPQYASDETLVHRFQREARAASRIEHPNIIQIFDFGQESDDTLYMAMELLRGKDLDQVIVHDAPMSELRLARIAMQIASALGEAHRQGVIHRDLKPANIVLIDRAEHRDLVKLFDFGIAKLEQTRGKETRILTTGGVVCGTPEFMSPEQVRGDPLDGRSDLYALGVVLYIMATGKLPLLANNPIDTAALQVTTRAINPRELRPDMSPQLEEIILRCLKKKPEARYADAHALFKELSQLVSAAAAKVDDDDGLRSEEISTDTLMHPTPGPQKQNKAQSADAKLTQSAAADAQPDGKIESQAARAFAHDDDALQAATHRKAWRDHPLLLPGIALLLGLSLSALGFGLLQALKAPEKSSSAAAGLTTTNAKNPDDMAAQKPGPQAQSPTATQAATQQGATQDRQAQNPQTPDHAALPAARTDDVKTNSAAHTATPGQAHDAPQRRHKIAPKKHLQVSPAALSKGERRGNRRLARLLRQGDIRHEAGDYDSALRYYQKAVQLAPDNPKVQQRLTLVYYNQGRAKEACKALSHFLRLRPHPPGEDYYREILQRGCRP